MKYLKRFNEEISSKKIRSVVAGSEATHKDSQKSRLLARADEMDITAKAIEQQQKSKQAEAERMKDPQYAFEKQFKLNQDSLSREFKNKNLDFYFTTKKDNKDICFKYSFKLYVGADTIDYYGINIWEIEEQTGLEGGTFEKQGQKQYVGLLMPSDESSYKGERISSTINNMDEKIPVLLTKEGIHFLPRTNELMKKITGNLYDEDGKYADINGVSLIGMSPKSKNELANFIKSYDNRATCGNGKLKVNGLEMPTHGQSFTIDVDDLTTEAKPLVLANVEITLDKVMGKFDKPVYKAESPKAESPKAESPKAEEKEKTFGGKIKSFLGFGK